MQLRNFFVLCLLACLWVSQAEGQTFKRKPKGKTGAAKTETKPVETPPAALPEEEPNTDPERITTHELKRKLDAKAGVVILDNRTGSAWIGSQVKIKGAMHMPMQDLMQQFDKLPKNKEIVTYCA